MAEQIPAFLKGQLLLAMPGMIDPNFTRTVTCLYEHTENGAVGGIVNRIHPTLSGQTVFRELKVDCLPDAEKIPVYMGGPVHMGEIFVLHGPPFNWKGCLQISPALAMSNTIDVLRAIAMAEGPEHYIIALGCSGWGAGQLESEIRDNAWLTCPFSDQIVFELPAEDRWAAGMQNLGIDPAFISDTGGTA